MIEQEWMRFESTGRIKDYLAYSNIHEDASFGQYRDQGVKENDKDRADHCAYRYGAGSDSHRGI